MELRQFVSKTIGDVLMGIVDARSECESAGFEVGLSHYVGSGGSAYARTDNFDRQKTPPQVEFMDFDVAVSVEDIETEASEGSASAGVEIRVLSAGFGGRGAKSAREGSESRASSVSRVQFRVSYTQWPSRDG